MRKEIYMAAIRGDVEFLKEANANDVESATAVYSDEDLLGLSSQGNNIIHIAAQFGHLSFIKAALESFTKAGDKRKLIHGTNSEGETPLHLAAKQRSHSLADHLITSYCKLFGSDDSERENEIPWMVQNNKGNTPLHVALMNGGKSIQVAAYLLRVGPEVVAVTNHLNQTPLHLAVVYNTQEKITLIIGTEMSAIKMINALNSQGAALSTRNDHFVQENKHNSLSLVSSLLEKNSEVCCLRDVDGMTPLLRAAINSNLPVVDAIINECPESIEVCDFNSKNLLHYIKFLTSLEARKVLEKPEISMLLIDQQDNDGNTPAHIAVMNHDFRMVKALVEHDANFAIKNKQGDSVQNCFDQFSINKKLDVLAETQIQSNSNNYRDFVEKENEIEVIKDELMSSEMYTKAVNGEWEYLREKLNETSCENHFVSRLPDGSNIIHLAIESLKLHEFSHQPCSKEQMIVDALKKYPVLLCQTNRLGETPLHLEMFHKMLRIRRGMLLFRNIKEHFKNVKEKGEVTLPLPPWKAKDVQGNTILHIAVKHDNFILAEYLIQLDANLVGEVNHSKQTPLHLLCQEKIYCRSINSSLPESDNRTGLLKLIVEEYVSLAVYSRDAEGFTPLLRAAKCNDLDVVKQILKHHPQSIRQSDVHGRNIFHYLDANEKEMYESIPHKDMMVLATQKDDDGNTPFDLAIETGHFWAAQFLIKCCGDFHGIEFYDWLDLNKKSTQERLNTCQSPRWFQDFLRSRSFVVRSMYGSNYGVRKEDIKEYMNPMGVVAALLATVTFTAAFTVPGGYKGDTGIPNLGKKAAFQVFMVADVTGMCSSMMVLFCLLWLLSRDTEGDELTQIMLVDMTIKFLLISFYTTLVAFMTGVYVTTISDTSWVAIFTCVLCSSLILLMRRPHIKFISILLRILPYHFKWLYCCKRQSQATAITETNNFQQE